METRKENRAQTRRLQLEQLPDRVVPSVAVDVLGLATIDAHLDLQASVVTPVASVNIDLTL